MKYHNLDVLLRAFEIKGLTKPEIRDVLCEVKDMYETDCKLDEKKPDFNSQEFLNMSYHSLNRYYLLLKRKV